MILTVLMQTSRLQICTLQKAAPLLRYLDATDDASAVHLIHYRGGKAFTRLNLVETGTVVVPLSVSAILGDLKANPAT